METKVAETSAPENIFSELLGALDVLFAKATGKALFRSHDDLEGLLVSINRFRALEQGGLFALAKDVIRAVIDRVDVTEIKQDCSSTYQRKMGRT